MTRGERLVRARMAAEEFRELRRPQPPRDRERECLEDIQNLTPVENLGRYPPGLVMRMQALYEVANNKNHDDFIAAQRLVREILARTSGPQEGAVAAIGPARIEVYEGRIEIPMPGAQGDAGPAAGESAEPAEGVQSQPPSIPQNGSGSSVADAGK